MNSSTSSSNGQRFNLQLRAIALALAMLLAVELGMRWLEPSLSADVQNMRQIPTVVSQLAASPGEHVLFLGNSQTRRGVDMDVLEPSLAAQGVATRKLSIGFIYPDSSSILDWYYTYHHNIDKATRPDVLIVSFSEDSLADTPVTSEQVRRLARHHSSLQDIPRIFTRDLNTISQRSEFLLAKASASFAQRDRVRVRAFDEIIPRYRQLQRELSQSDVVATASTNTSPTRYRYTRLGRFLAMVNPQAVEIIFVAMPMRRPYTIDPALPRFIQDAGAHFINLESVAQLNANDFADTLHLAPAGAKIYSRALAAKLAPLLPQAN